ncbi:expression site-associated gene (ESAG-like) protein, partial [Trypanosoma theileri]
NPTAVRRGDAAAPMLFTCDAPCYMPQIKLLIFRGPKDHRIYCRAFYDQMWRSANAYLNQRLVRGPETTYRYLSAGGFVARVWALRAATPVYYNVMSMVERRRWWCDNTIWSFVYVWSIWQNPRVPKRLRLPYGMVSLDYNHSFFLAPHNGVDAVPAILHLPGPITQWKRYLLRFMQLTSWVHELNKSSHSFVSGVRHSLSTTLVKVYNTSGHTNYYRFGDICPVQNVTRLDWLTSPQPK